MSDNFWKRVDHIVGILPFMAVFAVLVVAANVEIKDLDLWLHLAMGKFIALNGYVPAVDVLSNSIAGTPWVNHEWLFQVLVYHIHHAWGPEGLINMQVAVVSLTMLILMVLGYSKNRQLIVALMLFCLYLVFAQRFTIRPDIYSLLFFSIYIFALSLHIDKKWSLPLLVVVQVLWSNMHGFFFFGPLFVLIGIVSEFLKRRVPLPAEWNDSGRLTDEEYRRMKLIFLAVVLACLVNPLFIKGALYPIGVFFSLGGENKIFFQFIQELVRPVTRATVFSNDYMYYKLMIILSAVSFVFNRRRVDLSALLFWLVFLVFSLKAVRNMPFFAFAAYLVFFTNILNVKYEDVVPIKFTQPKFYHLTCIVLKLLFVVWMIGYYQSLSLKSYYDFDKYEFKSEFGGVSQRMFPDKAADFLVDNGIKGNFFNDFNSGAYLLGRAYPDIRVYIDGRTEVYGGAFFQNYQDIWERGNADKFEAAAAACHFTGAFLNSVRHHIPKDFLRYLYGRDDWRLVYFDYDAVVFLRDIPANREAIAQHAIDLSQWRPPGVDLYKLGALRVKPYRPYYRAYTLESIGLNDAALAELQTALAADPMYADAHDLAGKIYAGRQEFRKAFEHFRVAVTASPHNSEMRHNLALAYYDLGEYAGAAKEYDRIAHFWPADPRGHFLLAKARIMAGEYDKAVEALEAARAAAPTASREFVDLADLMADRGAYEAARASYQMADAAAPGNAVIQSRLDKLP